MVFEWRCSDSFFVDTMDIGMLPFAPHAVKFLIYGVPLSSAVLALPVISEELFWRVIGHVIVVAKIIAVAVEITVKG